MQLADCLRVPAPPFRTKEQTQIVLLQNVAKKHVEWGVTPVFSNQPVGKRHLGDTSHPSSLNPGSTNLNAKPGFELGGFLCTGKGLARYFALRFFFYGISSPNASTVSLSRNEEFVETIGEKMISHDRILEFQM